MSAPTRRDFLGLARGTVAVAAVGALGAGFIGAAEAMPVAPDLGHVEQGSHPVTEAQWGQPPRPGWRGRRRPRWVCWWHRGRRRCGWRW
jgi:hypothetical protein